MATKVVRFGEHDAACVQPALHSPTAQGTHSAHLRHLRDKWKQMSVAERHTHVTEPRHLYKYVSSFVPRGVTEGRIAQFALCINHLGSFINNRAHKYSLSVSTSPDLTRLVDVLVSGASDTQQLRTVMRIQDIVELDFIRQGWTYDAAQCFAYRTPASLEIARASVREG